MITPPAEICFIVPCLLSDEEYIRVLNNFHTILAKFENPPQNILCKPTSTTTATISFCFGAAIVRGTMKRSSKHQEVCISLLVPMDYATVHFNGRIPQECMRAWFTQAYALQHVEEETALV